MRIRVEGKHPLNGSYHPAGNTNAAMMLLAAALLTDKAVTLKNMPQTLNMQSMLAVAEKLGTKLTWIDNQSVTVQTEQISKRALTLADTNGLVSMMLFLPAMLARRQHGFRLMIGLFLI